MLTKNQTDYHVSIIVHATPGEACNAICRVSEWWTGNIKGSTKKPGDIFTVTFGETFSNFEVTEMEKNQKILWHVLDCNLHWLKDKKEWKGTDVLWEIMPMKEATEIQMTHIGLRPGIECFENCNEGWNHYIKESLLKLINEGKGVPDHPNYSARDRQ
jgi:hypothetical protein